MAFQKRHVTDTFGYFISQANKQQKLIAESGLHPGLAFAGLLHCQNSRFFLAGCVATSLLTSTRKIDRLPD
jgi:hypothetical protein